MSMLLMEPKPPKSRETFQSICSLCWPVGWVSLTLKVTGSLQGLQAITWPGCRHTFLKQNWFYPLLVENGNSPWAGWISPFSTTFSTPNSLGVMRRREMTDSSSATFSSHNLRCLTRHIHQNTEKNVRTYVFYQRGQSAKMLAPQCSRKRLGFRILCRGWGGGTATAGTGDYLSTMLMSHTTSINTQLPNHQVILDTNNVVCAINPTFIQVQIILLCLQFQISYLSSESWDDQLLNAFLKRQ